MKHTSGDIGKFAKTKNKAYPIIVINNDTLTISARLNFLVIKGQIAWETNVPTAYTTVNKNTLLPS